MLLRLVLFCNWILSQSDAINMMSSPCCGGRSRDFGKGGGGGGEILKLKGGAKFNGEPKI